MSSVSFNASVGQTYNLVVDGYLGAAGNYTINVACGGAATPTRTQTRTATRTATLSATPTAMSTNTPSSTPTYTPSAPSATATVTAIAATATPTNTPATIPPTATATATAVPPTSTPVPPTATRTATLPPGCAAATLTCGSSDTRRNDSLGSTKKINGYSCNTWTMTGPEYIYSFAPTSSGPVTVTLSNKTADLDLFVLNGTSGTCTGTSCLGAGM
jgi:hypothetical protein